MLDQAGIYVLVAGSYTPFALVAVGGTLGWTMFAVIGGLAAAGIVTRSTMPRVAHWVSVPLFLTMGWSALALAGPLLERLGRTGIALIVAGGLAYTLGVPFFAWRRAYAHAVWHVFVLAGSALHDVAVLRYVLS